MLDEFGPLEPTLGKAGHDGGIPIDCQQPFFDFHRDVLWGYFSQRKRWQEVLQALKRMRKKYPRRVAIFVIPDTFSPHRRSEIRRWARDNKLVLVWTPTNVSWLNRIKCQFTELKKYSIDNVCHATHRALHQAVREFLRYRNNRNKASPKHKKTSLKRH